MSFPGQPLSEEFSEPFWERALEHYEAGKLLRAQADPFLNASTSRFYYAVFIGTVSWLTDWKVKTPVPVSSERLQPWGHATIRRALRDESLWKLATKISTLCNLRIKADYYPESVETDEAELAQENAFAVLTELYESFRAKPSSKPRRD